MANRIKLASKYNKQSNGGRAGIRGVTVSSCLWGVHDFSFKAVVSVLKLTEGLLLQKFKYDLTVGVCYLSLIGRIGFQYQALDGGSYIGIPGNLWILILGRWIPKKKSHSL